ncbi:MAG: efflux RND transporter periplasmic adaptor subunit [Chitinispirillaceae bacterium]|nr:efflux RND transporter periplasmic adaptor subunit [Chitinispirillaceae bacterium]
MDKNRIVMGIAGITALSFVVVCKPPQRPKVQRIAPVEVYVAQPSSISSYVSLTGGIEAQNDAIVYSKIPERLVSLQVKPGDRVRAGQTLAIQYNEGALQGKNLAAAALKSAEVQLQTRRDDFTRMENLFAKKAVTRQQYDLSKSQLDIARISLEQAQATLEQAVIQYENTVLRAPFDGQVATVYFDCNEMVPAGQPVVKMINANTVKAKLNVPSVDIGKIAEGRSVIASFPALPDTHFTGIVYRMDKAIDPATRTLAVEVRLSNTGNLLTSGMFGEFRIETTRHEETVVVSEMTVMTRSEIVTDERGIQTDRPEYYVYIAGNGKAEKRVVTPGIVSGGFTELAKGVSMGDSIIVVGQNTIKEGDPIRVITETER